MRIINEHIDVINTFCKMHNVEKLYVFGSVTGKHFKATSDIDFLVRFKPIKLSSYFNNYITFKGKLKKLLNRDIDLIEEQSLKNPIFIASINKNKSLIYG